MGVREMYDRKWGWADYECGKNEKQSANVGEDVHFLLLVYFLKSVVSGAEQKGYSSETNETSNSLLLLLWFWCIECVGRTSLYYCKCGKEPQDKKILSRSLSLNIYIACIVTVI